jgi:DNA sulfur modification protein DndC
MSAEQSENYSAFEESGIEKSIQQLILHTQELYLSDQIPWVVGYSGGKDSTATLQLIWYALAGLKSEQRHKPVHVISTDTLVENPIVAIWVDNSLKAMISVGKQQSLPITPHRLVPDVKDRFWVNLVGKGYPAPRPKFRWCTSRLKISPSNKFITDMVSEHGEAILVLGTRKRESTARAKSMNKYEQGSTRDLLSRNGDLDRVWVYTPIAEWSNDDVWEYVCTYDNPWGYDNNELLTMYRGATEGGECPLVVDTSTPSCGDSRFGCFVCTLVEKDKSMQAMIQNDEEKQWMMPLVNLRNKYLSTDDRSRRDFRRMDGSLMEFRGRLVHGPYKQEFREKLLEEILKVQIAVREKGPQEVKKLELITIQELEEIRRIWVVEKHEIEDNLPKIYERVMKDSYPGVSLDERPAISTEDIALLREICQEQGDLDEIHYQLARELFHIEQEYKTKLKRSGIFGAINNALERGAYDSAEEAEEIKLHEATRRKEQSDSIVT